MTNELAEKPMSYEEMIDTLRGLVFGTFDRTTSKEREALGRAIDLLSNSDEDCISRAELIDKTIKRNSIWLKITDSRGMNLQEIIDGLPSLQPTAKENLVVGDCISRAELLKAVDTWDKFGCDADTKLVPVKDCYVPYIHYDDVVKAIKGMPSIQPKPKTDEPMQVELEGEGYSDGKLVYDYGKCPKCGWEFEEGDKDWEEPYCCHCGQRLKWFESEVKK